MYIICICTVMYLDNFHITPDLLVCCGSVEQWLGITEPEGFEGWSMRVEPSMVR